MGICNWSTNLDDIEFMISVNLTDRQLSLLSGHEGDNKYLIEVVAAAVERMDMLCQTAMDVPAEYSDFVGRVLQEVKLNGKLDFRHIAINRCDVCKTSAGYASYQRNSVNHRKDTPNFSKPLTLRGIDLVHVFISIKNCANLGCCADCWSKISPYLVPILNTLEVDAPEALLGQPAKWKKWKKAECTACGWTGHEGDLGLVPAMMRGGYRGQCPGCEEKNRPLGKTIVNLSTTGFVLLPV